MNESGYRNDLGASIHDVDSRSHTVAVDFPHEVLDSYRTDWGRGCWSEGFARQLPVMVWNHNQDALIGRATRAEHLGAVSRVTARFADFDRVPKAGEVHSLIADGIVPGFSFGFKNGRSIEHPSIRSARRYVKAHMFEISPVATPAIPGTRVAGIRSASLPASLRAAVAAHYRQLPFEHEMLRSEYRPSDHLLDELDEALSRAGRRGVSFAAGVRRDAATAIAERVVGRRSFDRQAQRAMPDAALALEQIERILAKARSRRGR